MQPTTASLKPAFDQKPTNPITYEAVLHMARKLFGDASFEVNRQATSGISVSFSKKNNSSKK